MPIICKLSWGGGTIDRVFLYKDGVINTDIGGGINANYTYYGSVVFNSNHIYMDGNFVAGSHFGRASIATINAVDLSAYKTLNIEYEVVTKSTTSAIPPVELAFQNSRSFRDDYLNASQPDSLFSVSSNVVRLPLSKFNSAVSKYPAFSLDPAVGSGSITVAVKVYKIWLEK